MIASLESLNDVVGKVKEFTLDKNMVVLLQGDLASGKTTFVKNYIKSLGIDEEVTSPTFSIQSIYENNIFHYDVYNKTLEEFIGLGLLEEFEKEGTHFVEWGDESLKKILDEYGFEVLTVQIKKLDNKREYTIGS
jgi:tRNA threonylcarbamoyladenosine biosynthesis protein TsaE